MNDNDAASVASSATPSAANANANANANNKKMEQMKKLKDANSKYKDLLKMAKQRIQSQEEELDNMKKGELCVVQGSKVPINVNVCQSWLVGWLVLYLDNATSALFYCITAGTADRTLPAQGVTVIQ